MLASIAVLALLHIFAMAIVLSPDEGWFAGAELIAAKFDMDHELTVPAFYSSSALLFCAALAGVISSGGASGERGYRLRWRALAVLLVLIALDEATELHESITGPLVEATGLNETTWAGRAWTLIYLPLAVGLGLVFWRFVWGLPPRTRASVITAGVVFVAGAGGGELIGTPLWRPDQEIPSTTYVVVSTIEELLEMLAVVILAYGLTTHLRDFIGPVTLGFRNPSRVT
jgi:hypothetical protein